MKKFSNSTFFTALSIWFASSAYLSINYMVNIFIDTNPYIFKYISMTSFIFTIIFGIFNRYIFSEPRKNKKNDNETDSVKKDRALKRPKCTACGKK